MSVVALLSVTILKLLQPKKCYFPIGKYGGEKRKRQGKRRRNGE